MVYLTEEEYISIVKGEFTLRPCAECDNGTLYIDRALGEIVSIQNYNIMIQDESYKDFMDEEICDKCLGIGKIVTFT